MPYDSFLITKLVSGIETPVYLTGIYDGSKTSLVFSLMKVDLIFEMGEWPHFRITNKLKIDKDYTPSQFVSVVRARLKGAVLKKVEQIAFDRIVKFEFEVKNMIGESEIFDLYHEVMGTFTNLVLVKDGKVVCAFREVSSSKRMIFAGTTYFLPFEDRVEPWKISDENFLKGSGRLDQFLVKNVRGFSKKDAVEVTKLAGISFDSQIESLKIEEIKRIVEVIHELVEEMDERTVYISYDDGKPVDLYAFKPYGSFESFPEPYEAIEFFLTSRAKKELFNSKKEDLLKRLKYLIDKNQEIMRKLSQEIAEVNSADEFKRYGELIISNLHALPKRAKSVEVIDWESGKTLSITLDPKMDVSKNAQHFFSLYDKLKKKVNGIKERQTVIEKRIAYLQETFHNVNGTSDRTDLDEITKELEIMNFIPSKKRVNRPKVESSPLVYEFNGFKILVGKNNIQNDRITRAASGDDLWFHARGVPGSHTVIITGGRIPPEDVVEFAASLAGAHSKYRNDNWADVDYTYVKYLSKPKGAKPGFVLYKNFKTIRVRPGSDL